MAHEHSSEPGNTADNALSAPACFLCMVSMPKQPTMNLLPPHCHFASSYFEDVIHPFPLHLPHTVKKWTYLAAIDSESSAVGPTISDDEDNILRYFSTYMFVSKRTDNSLEKMSCPSKSNCPYQRIALFKCMGDNQRYYLITSIYISMAI